MNGAEFIRNMSAYPADALLRYDEQHVAWSLDGREILAHAPTLADLMAEVQRLGLKDVVFDYISGAPRLGSGELADALPDHPEGGL